MTDNTTDWTNINLKDTYQRSLNILEPYSFETLLLELHCNVPTKKLTKQAVMIQAREVLLAKYTEALEILEANAENIHRYELKEREDI